MAVLYLIPTSLGETSFDKILPANNTAIITALKYFIVENIRTARRFIKKTNPQINIDELTFFELNQHTSSDQIISFIQPLYDGNDVGIISEAGCPAIADPGAEVVALAQARQFRVIPLIGPSSILLALMASGFNGQSFAFAGYLPIQPNERLKSLKKLENRAYSENQSQLFIETPYRNMKMFEDIISVCQSETRLCVAADITLDSEFIRTKTIREWRKQIPDLNKRPCIFILYK